LFSLSFSNLFIAIPAPPFTLEKQKKR